MNKPRCKYCDKDAFFFNGEHNQQEPCKSIMPWWQCPKCLHQLRCTVCSNILRHKNDMSAKGANICTACWLDEDMHSIHPREDFP